MSTKTAKYSNIRPEIKAFIVHSIREALDDPDYGLELKPEFVRKLKARLRSKDRKLIPHADVLKKYGLRKVE